jgi:hypothetical protein
MADLAIIVLEWFFVAWFVVAVIWTALDVLRSLLNSCSFISTVKTGWMRIPGKIKLPHQVNDYWQYSLMLYQPINYEKICYVTNVERIQNTSYEFCLNMML